MTLSKYVPVTRLPSERQVLRNNQFARWLSKETGVSSMALSRAIQIVSKGIVDALTEGYNINLNGLGVFELRELKPRIRYHRVRKERYLAPPSTIVHFRKSEKLTTAVRKIAVQKLDAMKEKAGVTPASKG